MTITHQAIINKIEKQLALAKGNTETGAFREHIRAVHALCEVLLEDNSGSGVQTLTPQVATSFTVSPISHPVRLIQAEEDEGESILDF